CSPSARSVTCGLPSSICGSPCCAFQQTAPFAIAGVQVGFAAEAGLAEGVLHRRDAELADMIALRGRTGVEPAQVPERISGLRRVAGLAKLVHDIVVGGGKSARVEEILIGPDME